MNYFSMEPHKDDDNKRTYHSRLRLLDVGYQVQGGLTGVQFVNEGRHISSVLEFALNIPGVAQAEVRAWELVIRKSPLFDWSEIETPLAQLMMGMATALKPVNPIEMAQIALSIRSEGG